MTKIWVMADDVPKSSKSYITEGKWYEVDVDYTDLGGEIVGDDKEIAYISFKCSSHIEEQDWNVHYGDTPPNNHVESSTISLESSTDDFKGTGDTEVAGEVENVSKVNTQALVEIEDGLVKDIIQSLKILRDPYLPEDSKEFLAYYTTNDFIDGLESGEFKIVKVCK